jgi:hypothetical protein
VKPFYPSTETVLPIKWNRSTFQVHNLYRYIEEARLARQHEFAAEESKQAEARAAARMGAARPISEILSRYEY